MRRRRWVERYIRTKQRRQNDRSMLSGPTNDSVFAGQVQAKLARARLPDLLCVLFCVSFVVAASERERERYYGMDASGWLGGNGKGTFLGGNTLAVMAHLATWDNSTAHTQHTTHTANGVIGMWEFCFVSWGFGLGLVCFVVLGRSRVCLVRLGFAAFLDFVRVCWAGSLAAFTWPGFRMVVVTGDCSGESDNNCLALFIE